MQELEALLLIAGYFAAISALAYWATSPTASQSRVAFGAVLAFLFGAAFLGLVTYGVAVKLWRARGRVTILQPVQGTQAVPATWGQQG